MVAAKAQEVVAVVMAVLEAEPEMVLEKGLAMVLAKARAVALHRHRAQVHLHPEFLRYRSLG